MKSKQKKVINTLPSVAELESELKRERYRNRYNAVLRSTVFALITVSAIAVLVATLLLPVLQIYGYSMTPSLSEGDIVVSVKTSSSDCRQGDIISFYYQNKILVKRVIAFPGEWVDIDENGTVSVNGKVLDEPYVQNPSLGNCDIELPYQVPDGRMFVLGDHRSTSQDSRTYVIGCVSEEQVVGKVVFKVWPPEQFGSVK